MFKSKKMLLIWTIILSWSVMAVGMDGGKAAPGGRTRGIPKRDYPADVVVEPDTAEEVPVLDVTDIAAIGAALKKERKIDRNRAYNDAHKEKRQAYDEARKEEKKDYNKAYYAARKAEILARQKAYNDAHKEERQAYNDANKAKRQAYLVANKAKMQAYSAAYRARKKAEKEAQKALAGAGSDGAAQKASV